MTNEKATMTKENASNSDKKTAENNEKMKSKIKSTWSKFSDADVALYNGQHDKFIGKLKEHYNLSKEEAEKKLHALEESCGCAGNSKKAA